MMLSVLLCAYLDPYSTWVKCLFKFLSQFLNGIFCFLIIPVFLPEKSHGWRSLAGYSPWGHKESDMTERVAHTHVFLNTDHGLYVEKKGQPRFEMYGIQGRWEGSSGWGTHVHPWLIHVNVWQNHYYIVQ